MATHARETERVGGVSFIGVDDPTMLHEIVSERSNVHGIHFAFAPSGPNLSFHTKARSYHHFALHRSFTVPTPVSFEAVCEVTLRRTAKFLEA